METKLARIAQLSAENPNMVFTSVGHLIDKELLKDCNAKMDGDKAVGIDGVTKEEYEKDLDANLENLVDRLRGRLTNPSLQEGWRYQRTMVKPDRSVSIVMRTNWYKKP